MPWKTSGRQLHEQPALHLHILPWDSHQVIPTLLINNQQSPKPHNSPIQSLAETSSEHSIGVADMKYMNQKHMNPVIPNCTMN